MGAFLFSAPSSVAYTDSHPEARQAPPVSPYFVFDTSLVAPRNHHSGLSSASVSHLYPFYQPQGIVLLLQPWWGKPSITGNKIIGDNCNQSLPGRIYNTAAYNSSSVTSKSHTHYYYKFVYPHSLSQSFHSPAAAFLNGTLAATFLFT